MNTQKTVSKPRNLCYYLFTCLILPAILLSACSPRTTAQTPDNPPREIVSDNENTASNDNAAPTDAQTGNSVRPDSIEYYLYQHACPNMHEDEACRSESVLHGMLISQTLTDKDQNKLTMDIFDPMMNNADPFLDGSYIQWEQRYAKEDRLLAYAGRLNESHDESDNHLYQSIARFLIPTPPFRNMTGNSSSFYESNCFGPNCTKDSVSSFDDAHRLIGKNIYSVPFEAKEGQKAPFTDENGKTWKYAHKHTYAYDEQGRLINHTEKIREITKDNRIDVYIYSDNNPCASSIKRYSPVLEDSYLDYEIRYLDSDSNILRYIKIKNDCDSSGQNCINRTPETIELSRRNCYEQLKWNLPVATTIYDKAPNAWSTSKKSFADNTASENNKLYSPDKPFDFDDVTKNFHQYRLDPKYQFEHRDYQQLTDEDAAHPGRKFQLSPKPVTQAEFKALMGFNPSYFNTCGDNCPVENVTWYQALAYCNAQSKKEGLEACYTLENCTEHSTSCQKVDFKGLDCNGYRLPTDEEWRAMAKNIELKRAQLRTDKADAYFKKHKSKVSKSSNHYEEEIDDIRSDALAKGAEADNEFLQTIAWFITNSDTQNKQCAELSFKNNKEIKTVCVMPHPVGTKKPDANGLYDFYGNVFEWIWDWYGYTSRSGDSLGANTGICRIMRGGSVFSQFEMLNHRYCYPPERAGSVLGFRLAKTQF